MKERATELDALAGLEVRPDFQGFPWTPLFLERGNIVLGEYTPVIAKAKNVTHAEGIAHPAEILPKNKARKEVVREEGLRAHFHSTSGGFSLTQVRIKDLHSKRAQMCSGNVLTSGLRTQTKPFWHRGMRAVDRHGALFRAPSQKASGQNKSGELESVGVKPEEVTATSTFFSPGICRPARLRPRMDSPHSPWWKQLNWTHWFVFAMAALAWMFDCLDQQLFNLARPSAMKALMPEGSDPVALKKAGGIATAIFVAGWAVGGLIFGAVGDRIGRAKTLTLTVLMYSVCTGLSAASQGFWDFAAYRFITGVGVGGVFGLSVALVADSLPDRARPHALGVLQALSAVGNVTAALIGLTVGYLELGRIVPGTAWRAMFVIGALPAFLCVFIQMRLKEPEKWVKAKAEGKATGVRFGSYPALLGDLRWRRRALLAMAMCIAAVIGLWGIGLFSVELINDVIAAALKAEGVPAAEQAGYRTIWSSVTLGIQNVGAFLGMMAFTAAANRFGRKPVFAAAFICAMLSTILVFKYLNQRSDIFWMIPLMGFFQFSIFAGFAIYLPELFPTSLRSTGTSFCYNVGRFIAASGPWVQTILTGFFVANATDAHAKLEGFRSACCWLSGIYLLGVLVLPFLPETKGQALPEE